ncbi:MAG: hypothetical protein SPE37_04155, partial [Campylobacter sp.]|nr:hypothetical protein [Campylobacter sp.]
AKLYKILLKMIRENPLSVNWSFPKPKNTPKNANKVSGVLGAAAPKDLGRSPYKKQRGLPH